MPTTQVNPEAVAELQNAFKTNRTYYEMIHQHNLKAGSLPQIEQEMLSFLKDCQDGETLLDAGCGEGSITTWIGENYPKLNIIGVDLSPVGIEMSKKDAESRKIKNIEFKVGDLQNLELEANSIGRVFSESVFEHVPDVEAVLAELKRVMKPGAVAIVRVGNAASAFRFSLKHYLFHPTQTITQTPSLELQEGNFTQHQHNFDIQEMPGYTLEKLVQKSGFQIISRTTFPSHLWNEPGSFGRRLVLRSLILLRWLPLISLIGPTEIVRFRKPTQ